MNIYDGSIIFNLPTVNQAGCLKYLRSGKLASGLWNNKIRMWNTTTGIELPSLTGHTAHIFSIEELSNNYLASGSADMTIKIGI